VNVEEKLAVGKAAGEADDSSSAAGLAGFASIKAPSTSKTLGCCGTF